MGDRDGEEYKIKLIDYIDKNNLYELAFLRGLLNHLDVRYDRAKNKFRFYWQDAQMREVPPATMGAKNFKDVAESLKEAVIATAAEFKNPELLDVERAPYLGPTDIENLRKTYIFSDEQIGMRVENFLKGKKLISQIKIMELGKNNISDAGRARITMAAEDLRRPKGDPRHITYERFRQILKDIAAEHNRTSERAVSARTLKAADFARAERALAKKYKL